MEVIMDAVKNRILLTVDGSEPSLNAVHYASKTLNPLNTELVLLGMQSINIQQG